MKFVVKSLVAATAFVMMGAASAAPATVNVGGTLNGLTLVSGTGKLAFSADLLSALDTGKVKVSSYAPGTAIGSQDADGFYTEVSATAVITSTIACTSLFSFMIDAGISLVDICFLNPSI